MSAWGFLTDKVDNPAHSLDRETLPLMNIAITFQVFKGNKDKDTVVSHVFPQHIRARFVRILPQTWYGRLSMRAELYGCSLE